MSQPSDPHLPIIVAMVSGLFALLGGFFGAWLARRTEYEKWLRQERSTAFAEYLRQLHEAREKALDTLYDNLSEQELGLKVNEIFLGLNAQENIVRLYLSPADRDKFSELQKKLWLLHSPGTTQATRIEKVEGALKQIQAIFERTVHFTLGVEGARMKLNGWMRLLIVLSVSWLAVVGYSAYEDISTLYTKKRFEVSKEGIGQAQFLFSAAQTDTEIEQYISNELTPLIEKNPTKYVGKTDATPFNDYITKHATSEIREHIQFALAPIFGLFAFGWSVAWVRRGFTGKTDG